MPEVLDYRHNLIAAKRWSRLDTGETVIARVNGLPVTAASLVAEMPSDVDPFDSPFYFAPEKDPA